MREVGEEVTVHRRDPAGPLLGRAGHKGLAPSGNAYVCKSQEAEASHVEGCWVSLAGALGLGHTPHPRGPDISPAAPLASCSSSLLPPSHVFPPMICVCLALLVGLLYVGSHVPLSLCPG